MSSRLLAPSLVAIALLCARPTPARACGGCFSPPNEVTTVESHRMVIALGVEKTTLWDQITYSGDPQDFVWVLPVPTTATVIEIGDPDFFDSLDSGTTPIIAPLKPLQQFCGGGQAAACGGAAGASGDDSAPGGDAGPGVDIFSHQTVGPYDTVLIGADDANALTTWMSTNGYQVPDGIMPTLQFYLDQHAAFWILRLAPGEGDDAMEPVRVRYNGYMGSFPLRMVAAGAPGQLSLSLWVIAEQRYQSSNYPTLQISPQSLVWDWATNTSNYLQLFASVLDGAGGRAWIVEYAAPLSDLYIDSPEDLAVIHESVQYPYLTRLRTNMLVDYLDEDLELAPSAAVGDVPRYLYAPNELNRPPEPDCDTGGDCVIGLSQKARGVAAAFVLLAAGLILIVRRRLP